MADIPTTLKTERVISQSFDPLIRLPQVLQILPIGKSTWWAWVASGKAPKGIKLGEIKVAEVRKEKGNFSWGSEVEKTYYGLGDKAQPKGDKRVKEYFDSKK